ncbi:hypothetical protein [Nocardia asteroides]|uniref:hypothetical protein n=1 Tax=Nocardia asteroides TaxID=1824 RepID=UPI001E56BE60|nr:hypothetical protein [Nocardia asteroides]UGT61412.1 hypothetical protein LTT61_30535 [Nocardia asteroides]
MAREELADAVTSFCASSTRNDGPLIVGISGPQGCGKSTLTAAVTAQLNKQRIPSVAISIDDFYLTHSEQAAIAARYPGNRYLEHRGYPGTHSIALGSSVLDTLVTPSSEKVRIPVYNKGANGGRGDRAPFSDYRKTQTPLAVIILEGWMLGFKPVPSHSISDIHLKVTNTLLAEYSSWHDRLGAFVHLDAVDPLSVVQWRIDAERAQRTATGIGLNDEQAADYVERFLPAYRMYVPELRANPPIVGPYLRIAIDNDRLPTNSSL